jgi:hypothetical protein
MAGETSTEGELEGRGSAERGRWRGLGADCHQRLEEVNLNTVFSRTLLIKYSISKNYVFVF